MPSVIPLIDRARSDRSIRAPEVRSVIDVELFGAERARDAPPFAEIRRLCALAASSAGLKDGHVAIEFVGAERIAQLNAEHRGKATVTDVLSFPIDAVEPIAVDDRELGDVVICPEHTADLREAIVHGMLHLVGMDHETDNGEMLALQRELLARGTR
jgi:probable rRNA maturation factor